MCATPGPGSAAPTRVGAVSVRDPRASAVASENGGIRRVYTARSRSHACSADGLEPHDRRRRCRVGSPPPLTTILGACAAHQRIGTLDKHTSRRMRYPGNGETSLELQPAQLRVDRRLARCRNGDANSTLVSRSVRRKSFRRRTRISPSWAVMTTHPHLGGGDRPPVVSALAEWNGSASLARRSRACLVVVRRMDRSPTSQPDVGCRSVLAHRPRSRTPTRWTSLPTISRRHSTVSHLHFGHHPACALVLTVVNAILLILFCGSPGTSMFTYDARTVRVSF